MVEEKINVSESLAKLSEIVDWFDGQEEVDVEAGLEKVKEAAQLIKQSKTRLGEIENEFNEIEKEMEEVVDTEPEENIDEPDF